MELSGDKVGIEELWNEVDIHTENQKYFEFPGYEWIGKDKKKAEGGRLTAKVFLFRLIFGGSAYSYANDTDFVHISKSEKYWQEIIDAAYFKYKGLSKWHQDIVKEVTQQGYLRSFTGREWRFAPTKGYQGEMKWPDTKIKNYPVQGTGADLVSIARVSSWRRFKEEREANKVLFINSVHDDIQLDIVPDPELCYNICIGMEKVFQDVPANVKKIYGYKMKVPLAGEVSFGMDLGNMKEFNSKLGIEQFNSI